MKTKLKKAALKTNSQKQMNSAEIKREKDLPVSEVCSIVEACGKAGVRVIKYGNLYVAFGPAPIKEEIVSSYPISAPIIAPIPTVDHARQNADTLAKDEDEIRAEQLRMLMIENPMEFERQLRDGELSDEPSEPDDGET